MDWRCAKVNGDTITIRKEDLEKARAHYRKISDRYDADNLYGYYYAGKADVLIDLLKQFEQLEG